MGTSRSFAEVARKLDQAAKNIQADMPRTVLLAAEAAKAEIDQAIKGRVPDGEMSGLVRRGRGGKFKAGKVGTRIARGPRVAPGESARSVRAVGPVHWLEAGTRPHVSAAGRLSAGGQVRLTKKGKYRAGQRKVVNIPGVGWRTGPIQHPGMPAGHTWSKGVRAATPKAKQAMATHVPRAVLRPFT